MKDCLKQNEQLRYLLDKLRSEQASPLQTSDSNIQSDVEGDKGRTSDPSEVASENLSLKVSCWSKIENVIIGNLSF